MTYTSQYVRTHGAWVTHAIWSLFYLCALNSRKRNLLLLLKARKEWEDLLVSSARLALTGKTGCDDLELYANP